MSFIKLMIASPNFFTISYKIFHINSPPKVNYYNDNFDIYLSKSDMNSLSCTTRYFLHPVSAFDLAIAAVIFLACIRFSFIHIIYISARNKTMFLRTYICFLFYRLDTAILFCSEMHILKNTNTIAIRL